MTSVVSSQIQEWIDHDPDPGFRVEAFPAGRLRSVSLRRPTLADAYLALTGEALDEGGRA